MIGSNLFNLLVVLGACGAIRPFAVKLRWDYAASAAVAVVLFAMILFDQTVGRVDGILLLVLFVLKEGFMLVMGAIKLREGKKLNGAKWFGKCCTALLFVVLFLLLLFPHMSLVTVNVLILLCAAAMFITLLLYIPVFRSM